MRLRHLLVALIAIAAIAAGPAEAKTRPVASLERATPVREHAGWLLYSRWDGSHYRLTAQRDGQTLTLPVPASAEPHDADVGPDSDKRCGAIEPPDCRPIEDVELPAMELWGRWVAQRWTYRPDGFGARRNEVRLTNVDRSDTRQLASSSTGIGGQTYLGPSIAKGRVAFFRACHADLGGCSSTDSRAIRYRICTEEYRLDGAVKGWTGWAWSGAAGFHVPSAFDCGGNDPGATPKEPCAVYRRDALDWERASASRFR